MMRQLMLMMSVVLELEVVISKLYGMRRVTDTRK